MFGSAVQRGASLRHDSDRTPPDYLVLSYTVPSVDSAKLLLGEEELIDFLVENFSDVEDDFIILCQRRYR